MTSIINQLYNIGDGDAALILGDIEFGHMEVPDSMNFGGDQLMTVHQLVGGKRIINTLGKSESDISWSGFFFGESAFERARSVDFLRVEGQEIELVFGEFLYLVVIKSFSAQLERFYQLPYTITLTVVDNLTAPAPFPVADGYNDAVNADLELITDSLLAAGSAALSSAVSDLSSAISSAGVLSSATPDQLNNITNNITNCQNITNSLINSSGLS